VLKRAGAPSESLPDGKPGSSRPAGPDDEYVIDVRDLRMRYGQADVLNGVTFTARRGEVLVVLGPNGAGKTTAIEILEGFRIRSAGQVSVLGVDPAHGGEAWRARIGVVLQSWRDHGKWRVRELLANLGSYYAPYSSPEASRPWDTDELIAMVGLTEHANQRLRQLSGGQRRRLDVAVGMVGRPELLFLDEPTAGFDPEARREFHDLVHRLVDQEEATILLTTHDLDEAEKLADRILIMAGGEIIADGSADELSRRMSTQAEVRWSRDGQRFVHSAGDPAGFVRELLRQYGESVEDLEVSRAGQDGTLLRAKATPNGMLGYLIGRIVVVSGTIMLTVACLLIVGLAPFGGLALGRAETWLTLAWVLALGLLATLPIGAVLGSLFRSVRGAPAVMLGNLVLIGISGIFDPITELPTWLQWVGQVFPLYWIGLGVRSAVLPSHFAAVEIGYSWRHLATAGVLVAWAIAGLVLAPILLRRVARREAGSSMTVRRERVMTQGL
jgi:ABC-2 type transport system ATP-binding protein